jgi:hypothetical protein
LLTVLVILIAVWLFIGDQMGFSPRLTIGRQSRCVKVKPISGKFVKVLAVLKADDMIKVREFYWEGVDYAYECFNRLDNTLTFNAWVPLKDSLSSTIDLHARSERTGVKIEYSFKFYDLADNLLAQFPANGQPGTKTITSIGAGFKLDTIITIKKP